MTTFIVPATLAEVLAGYGGDAEQLHLAGWRIAIRTYLLTAPGKAGQPSKLGKSDSIDPKSGQYPMSFRKFAELGIHGFSKLDTVAEYWHIADAAIKAGVLAKPGLNHGVEIPDVSWHEFRGDYTAVKKAVDELPKQTGVKLTPAAKKAAVAGALTVLHDPAPVDTAPTIDQVLTVIKGDPSVAKAIASDGDAKGVVLSAVTKQSAAALKGHTAKVKAKQAAETVEADLFKGLETPESKALADEMAEQDKVTQAIEWQLGSLLLSVKSMQRVMQAVDQHGLDRVLASEVREMGPGTAADTGQQAIAMFLQAADEFRKFFPPA